MANGDCPEGTGNPSVALTADPPRYTGPPEVLEMMTVQGPAGTAAIFVAAVPTAHCPASIATAQTAPAEIVTSVLAGSAWLNVVVDPCAYAKVPEIVTVVPVWAATVWISCRTDPDSTTM